MKERLWKLRKWFGAEELNKLSLFWKHMLMMLCILLMATFVLISNHQRSVKTLTKENLSKYQIALERDCAVLNEMMYITSAIPDGIEGTRYYDYIKGVNTGKLDEMYYPVLRYIRKALYNQIYLQGDNEMCLLYLAGCNSIVTNERLYPVAENCFSEYLRFTETGGETIIGYLRDTATMLLPMQPVKIGTADYRPCIALIVHNRNSPMGVMTLYSQEKILDTLGFTNLPTGTYIQMTAEDGKLLLQYPQAITEEQEDKCYRLSSSMEDLGVAVTVWVPETHFVQLLRSVQIMGIGSILLVLLLGVTLACWFSKISVVPIRKLIRTHDAAEAPEVANEIVHLDNLLSTSKEKRTALQNQVIRQILARSFSGGVLSESDERQLLKSIPCLSERYQVAVLHTTAEINPILGQQLEAVLPECVWTVLSKKETGLILAGTDAQIAALTQAVQAMNTQLPEQGVHCGISAPSDSIASLHIAVRQARVALPQDRGCGLFPGGPIDSRAISWLQHERLYQSIFANDEEDALRLLNSIATQTNHANAREVFYNIRFVLRSAAEEMGVATPQDVNTEYMPSLLPRENIRNLTLMLHTVFAAIREKNRGEIQDWKSSVLEYIRQNLSDSELFAASVADHFGVSEKRVYEAVRAMTDMSFKEYLTDLRMKKAANLLYSSRDGIAEVARQCGYRNSSTFYRLFQEYHGMAPGQFRKEEPSQEE